MRPRKSEVRSDAGQVLPLLALTLLLAGALVIGIVRLGGDALDRAQARTAADAAALAGAADGREAAVAVAEANHATLVEYRVDGPDVEVVVRVDQASAVARARRVGGGRVAPPRVGPAGGVVP